MRTQAKPNGNLAGKPNLIWSKYAETPGILKTWRNKMNFFFKKLLYNIFYVQNSGHLLRITVLGIRFKIKHKYFAKPARYGYKKIAALEEGNKIITDHIKSGKPFALGRFGWSELNIIHSYYRQRNKKNIHFNPDHIDVIKYNAGFFPQIQKV